MKITHTVIITIAVIIMVAYAFGGLGFMIIEKVGYQPNLTAQIIMVSAMVLGANSFLRRLKYA